MTAGGFYHASAEAASRLGRRAVLLVGRDPRNLPERLPDGVAAFEYAPYSELLPRAAAVVHQGGVGTTAQTLRAGVPMLVMPFSHDQPDNAARAQRLGVGRSIGRHRYTVANVVAELKPLLRDPAYARSAREVGALIRREDGVARACEVIEGM
jgi:UDP:flavonoid glycosyltransferase YjiC (YdhE family)